MTSVRDEGSLAEIKDMLPKMERIGHKDKEISKHFELHDQLFKTVFQAKAGDAWDHFLMAHPGALADATDEESAAKVVTDFLAFYDIEFTFDPEREQRKEEINDLNDDLANYDREGIAYWVLAVLLDDGEAEEDPELLAALRLTLMLVFLNKHKGGQQTAAYSYFLLLDRVIERIASERSQRRMQHLVCVNPSGMPGGGEFRDQVMEHTVRTVKGVFDGLGINEASDLQIQKAVAALTPTALICEHERESAGLKGKFKQHSGDLIGPDRREMIRQRIEEVAAFSPVRQPVQDYLQKPRGSPFENLTVPSVDRFLVRHRKNFFRRFPVWKEK
jgi:hypothetical protein